MPSHLRRSAAARRHSFLTVEALEDRSVLAGNVFALAAGGYLTLIGDSADNQLTITRSGTAGVQVTATGGTTINGGTQTTQIFNNVTQGVFALLGNGNDTLELRGSTTGLLQMSGITSINTGEGSDIVRFTNYSTGSLILLTGGGNDQVFGQLDAAAPNITTGGLRVNGGALVNTGAGNDTVSLNNSAFQSSHLLDVGAGNDSVDVRNSTFNGYTSLSGSIGRDTLNSVGNTFSSTPFTYLFETQTATTGATANNDTATVSANGTATINVLTNDTATSGTLDASTVTIVTQPTRGTAVVNSNGSITYTNSGGGFTSDLLTYTVRDSQGNLSNVGTVNITVTAQNSLPTATTDNFTVTSGVASVLNLGTNDSDPEGRLNLGSITIVQQPANGNITVGTNGNVTYTSTVVGATSDSFTYTIADQDGGVSTAATVNLTITGQTQTGAPTIGAIANQTTNEDTATSAIAVTVNDAQTPAGSLNVTATSSNTTLIPNANLVFSGTGSNRALVVTPAANQSGTATITVTATDADNNTTTTTFDLTVNAQNDAPTIGTIANVSTNEDTATGAVAVNVNDAETAAGSLNVTATSSNTTLIPNSGIVVGGSGANRTLTITPAANQSGTSTITVTATDANNLSTTSTFVVTVNGQNDAPTISAISNVSTNEDTATSAIALVVNDSETPAGALTVTATSSNPTLVTSSGFAFGGSGSNRTLTITPAANQSGTSTITVTATDADNVSTTQTFTLTVNAQNDNPTIGAIADQSTNEDTATSAIAVQVGDPETAAGSLTVTATSSNTTLVPNGNIVVGGSGGLRTLVITPAANQTGTATITVTATDPNSGTTTSTFQLTVNAQNDAPSIAAVSDISTTEDTAATSFTINVGDAETPNGVTVTATSSNPNVVATDGVSITGTGATRTVVVTPVADASGTSTITLNVSDGTATTSETFLVTVNAQNDNPTISTIADVNAAEDIAIAPFTFTLGDIDSNLDLATFTVTSDNQAVIASSGVSITGTGATRTVTITPAANASGTANVTIQANDGSGGTVSETFALNIAGTNDAPVAIDDNFDLNFPVGSTTALMISGNVLGNDTDADANTTLSINGISGGTVGQSIQLSYGDLVINSDGSFTYTIDPDLVDQFMTGMGLQEVLNYQVFDGTTTDSGELSIDLHIV